MVKFVVTQPLLRKIPQVIVADTDAEVIEQMEKLNTAKDPLRYTKDTRDMWTFRRGDRIFAKLTRLLQVPRKEDLDFLNELRAAKGKAPIRNWFSGPTALAIAIQTEQGKPAPNIAREIELIMRGEEVPIQRYKPGVARGAYKTKTEALDRTNHQPRKIPKLEDKPTKSAPTKRKPGASAASVLDELGIEPRKGRALLRKHNIDRGDPDAIRKFFAKR